MIVVCRRENMMAVWETIKEELSKENYNGRSKNREEC